MALVQFNPWQDAARYGSGLADTLGQLFLGLPRQRFEMARERAEAPLQQQLLEAQIANLRARPEMNQQLLDLKQENLRNQEERTRDLATYQQGENTIREENNQLKLQLSSLQDMLKGASNVNETEHAANTALNDFAQNLNPSINTKETPVSIEPNLLQDTIKEAMGAAKQGQSPEAASLHFLTKIAPVLAPILQTNTPSATTNWLGRVTQPPSNVTTNSFQLRRPDVSMGGGKPITPEIANQYLQKAGGDNNAARQLARQDGYTF